MVIDEYVNHRWILCVDAKPANAVSDKILSYNDAPITKNNINDSFPGVLG